MQTMMKHRKAIAFVLTLAMLFSIVPAAAWADDAQPVQNTVQLMQTDAETTTAQALMMNIASSNVNSTDEWMVMDMAAYHALNPDSPQTTAAAKQAYINKAIASITDTAGETTLSKAVIILSAIGINPAELYPANSEKKLSAVAKLKEKEHNSSAWVAPYTLAAYQRDSAVSTDKETALIKKILDEQRDDGSWKSGSEEYGYEYIQTTANAVAGLAFYYDADESVKAAVDKAIAYLSKQQQANGSFDAYGYGADSNTAAMVVIALAAAGINPDTDDRFIKNGISVYDNLLSYAYSDNSGFGYQDNQSDPWGSSTEQGFRALIAAEHVMKNTKTPYNIYGFVANSLKAGYANGIGAAAVPSTPSGSSNVTVTVSIKGLDDYWLKDKSVTLKDDATMYWALVDAIKGSGITQTGAENGYVREMSKNGTSLAEFDYGRNSGWLYKVNNQLPEVGLLQYTVKNGDKIEWYYTRDWTTDSLAGGRVNDTDKKAAASVDELLDKLLKDLGSLDNITADDADAIAQIRKAYDALTDEQKALVKGYDDLVAAEAMLEALLGETEELPFADIENHWAGNSIRFVYENGLMRGVSDTDFAPDATFSRAMLVAVLHRMAGEPAANGAYPFADVRDTAWYANPVAWAYQNKLAGGMTETQYAPNAPITREQLAVMLMRFAQYMDYDTADTIRLVHYKDAGSVSGYAEGAVKWAVANGILKGRNLNELAPQGTATRAEVAVMLERFVNLYTADKQA